MPVRLTIFGPAAVHAHTCKLSTQQPKRVKRLSFLPQLSERTALGARSEHISEDDAFHPSRVAPHFIQPLTPDPSGFYKTGIPFFDALVKDFSLPRNTENDLLLWVLFHFTIKDVADCDQTDGNFTKAPDPELRCGPDQGRHY